MLVVAHEGSEDALPFGPFDPAHHRTLESGLRNWVGEQTKLRSWLYRAALHFRRQGPASAGWRPACRRGARGVGRLSGADPARSSREAPDTQWRGWYHYFPWEDWREQKPAMIDSTILPALKKFVKDAPNAETARH